MGTNRPILLIRKKAKGKTPEGKSLYNVCAFSILTQFMHFIVLNARMSFTKDRYSSSENNDLVKNSFKFIKRFNYRFTNDKLIFSSKN